MISVSGKNWQEKVTNKNSIEKLKQDYNFSSILSKLIVLRKFDENKTLFTSRFYRIINEIPTVLLIGIVLVVVLKPL